MKLARWIVLPLALVAFACFTVEQESGPPHSLDLASSSEPVASVGATSGYWLVSSDGGVFNFGDASFYGSTGGLALNKPVVAMAPTPDGKGYWLVSSDGGVFTFGDASFYGSTGGLALNKPVVAMAPTPDGKGYWLVSSDGGVFNFGDASFYGSTGGLALNKPVVAMAPTPDGKGYWLVSSDGGVFTFGDASFYGSTGGLALNKPVVAMAPTPDGKGYWLVSSDGGVFNFGDASFYGSTGGLALNKPVVAMAPTPDGKGYWMVSSDGGVFNFGDASFYGSTGGLALNKPVVAMGESAPTVSFHRVRHDGPANAWHDAPDASITPTVPSLLCPDGRHVGGATYTPSASSTSGLAPTITVDSSSTGTCSMSGGLVSFDGAGTCTVDANQAGNAGLGLPPRSSSPSRSVRHPDHHLQLLCSGERHRRRAPPTPRRPRPPRASPRPSPWTLRAPATCSISGGVVSFKWGWDLHARRQPGRQLPAIRPPPRSSSPSPSPRAPRRSPSPRRHRHATVGGATYTPTATGGLAWQPGHLHRRHLDDVECSISGGRVSFIAAGTCIIDANQAGNASYRAAPRSSSPSPSPGTQRSPSPRRPPNAAVGGATYTPSATAPRA